MSRLSLRSSALVAVVVTVSLSAHAEDSRAVLVDRVAVRFISSETGGAQRPAFLTERELSFGARLESLFEDNSAPYVPQDRFLRDALDRHIARTMLAELLVQRGVEPPDLLRLVDDARAELVVRVGGEERLVASMRAEGIDEIELREHLKRRIRAGYYIDKAIHSILSPTEDEAKEAFHALTHPYKTMRYEDSRAAFLRWLVHERIRTAELEFYQVARSRVRVIFPPA